MKMDDLISRAAAILIAERYGCNNGSALGKHSGVADCIASEIAALQAVDAALVVHGRWLGKRYDFKEYKYVIVPYDVTTFDNPDDLFCSVCNEPALSNGTENDVPSNYCPNCGARMDGERRGSE